MAIDFFKNKKQLKNWGGDKETTKTKKQQTRELLAHERHYTNNKDLSHVQ